MADTVDATFTSADPTVFSFADPKVGTGTGVKAGSTTYSASIDGVSSPEYPIEVTAATV